MKTKVKSCIGAVAIFAIALGVNASIGMTNGSGDVALSDLVNASEANAECAPFEFAHGHCLHAAQICVFDTEKIECNLIQCKNCGKLCLD